MNDDPVLAVHMDPETAITTPPWRTRSRSGDRGLGA